MSNTTKKALANSLKELMQKTSLEKITVKDIVEQCEVNRQTFYYHFQDIYELLGWIYKTEAVDAINDFKSYKTWQQGFLKILQYVYNNKTFCMNTLNSLGREHLENFLYNTTFDLLYGVVQELSQNSNILQEDKEFIAKFFSWGFIGLLLNWMQCDMKERPEYIIEKLSKLIDGDIVRAIYKYERHDFNV